MRDERSWSRERSRLERSGLVLTNGLQASSRRSRGMPDTQRDPRVEHLYDALLTIVRQNAQGFPIGHDAILAGRKALAAASGRSKERIDWANERKWAATAENHQEKEQI